MINAARTLLLNIEQRGELNQAIGDEFVSPDFKPVRYRTADATNAAKAVRTALFGSNPDKLTLNYKAAQAMRLLHSDPVARAHVLALGDKLTYVTSPALFDMDPTVVIRTTVADMVTASVVGHPHGDPVRGQALRNFNVDAFVADSLMFVEYRQASGGIYGVDTGEPRLFVLMQSGTGAAPFNPPDEPHVTINFGSVLLEGNENRLGTGWLEITDADDDFWAVEEFETSVFVHEARFLLTATAKPRGSMVDVAQKFDAIEASQLDFGLPAGEPYDTFRSMSAPGNHRIRRTCGVLLMLVYATHLAREAS